MSSTWIDDVIRHVAEERAGYGYTTSGRLRGAERADVWSQVFWKGAQSLAWAMYEISSAVKSPLEEMFAVSVLAHALDGESTVLLRKDASPLGLAFLRSGRADSKDELTICTQVPVKQYVCDFVIEWKRWGITSSVAVEIDGHDFHEKTRQQAAHDKKRDRMFTKSGVKLFRFTGIEVHRDAAACAGEVLEFLEKEQADEIDGLSRAHEMAAAQK